MLSELGQVKKQLLRFIRNWGNLKRTIKPSPKISMGKQIHSQQGHQVRKGPIKLGSELKKPQDQHRDQCCPNLNSNSIGAGPHKGLDLEVLFQSSEEDLDLPPVFVDGSNRGRSQLQVIGQEDQDLLRPRVIDLDASERIRTSLDSMRPFQFDHFIFEDVTVLREFSLSNHFVQSIVFHAGYKIDLLRAPSAPEGIVGIAPIIDDNRSRSEIQLLGNLHIRDLPFGDPSELGKIPIVIQKQMEFDCPFGPSEPGPVKDAQAKIDRGRVEADQFVLKPKLLSPSDLHPTAFEQLEEDFLIELPRTVLVGISQGGAMGRRDAQMLQFPLTASQPCDNLSEGMGSA